MNKVIHLLEEVESFLGIEKIIFDKEGFCTLQIQDQFLLILRFDEPHQRLVIAAEIATVPELSKELLISALAFNFQRMAAPGDWLALDQETGALFLADEFLIELIEKEEVRNRLEQFFQHYLTCQGFFSKTAVATILEKERSISTSSSQLR